MEEHPFVGGCSLHVSDEEVGTGEVVVEDVESGFEGWVEGERGYGCCERWGGWFGGWKERRLQGEDVVIHAEKAGERLRDRHDA